MRATRTRAAAILSCVLLVDLVAGCGERPFMPRVPDGVVDRLGDDRVAVVAEVEDTNPTSSFLYTYAMLEVTGDRHIDTIASMLLANGWDEVASLTIDTEILLSAKLRSEADLDLVTFTDYRDGGSSLRAVEEFEQIPTDPDRGYYVAILTPLVG
jgi:hypothetical protein